MFSQLKLGMIESADQKVKLVRRPILTTLFKIMHKSGEQDLEPYENFVQRVQGVVDEIIIDPNAIDMDAFARQLDFKQPDLREVEQYNEEEHGMSSARGYKSNHFGRHIGEHAEKSDLTDFSGGRRGHSQMASYKNQFEDRRNSRLNRTGTEHSAGRSSRQAAKRPDAASQRTGSSGKKGVFAGHKQSVTSGRTNVTFFNETRGVMPNFGNLDLKPAEDIDEIILQRNSRFEALQKYQKILEF